MVHGLVTPDIPRHEKYPDEEITFYLRVQSFSRFDAYILQWNVCYDNVTKINGYKKFFLDHIHNFSQKSVKNTSSDLHWNILRSSFFIKFSFFLYGWILFRYLSNFRFVIVFDLAHCCWGFAIFHFLKFLNSINLFLRKEFSLFCKVVSVKNTSSFRDLK